MKRTITFTLFAITVFATSCHRYYTSSSFDKKASRHKIIAVIPPQVTYTGKLPQHLSAIEVMDLEEKESKIYLEVLYNNLLKKANAGRYELSVDVQPPNNTIATLANNHVSIRESWEVDDQELCKILGVDAVVRTTIKKERFMSDLASAGLAIGTTVLRSVIIKNPVIPTVDNKTNDIWISCAVVAGGETLWNDSYKKASNWNAQPNEIIEKVTKNFGKNFPYKRRA